MKSVLLSIKPKYCELIANGKKTVEVRKTKPKLDTPFKCYIYCTKGGLNIYSNGKQYVADSFEILKNGADEAFEETSNFRKWNGKVIGEFICNKTQNLFSNSHFWIDENIVNKTCLNNYEIRKYANGADKIYGWHISDLVIYDKPKELGKFYTECKSEIDYKGDWFNYKPLTRPSQSWCYVEEVEEK